MSSQEAPANPVRLPVHPDATLAFILGVLGCLITIPAPVAWVLGRRAIREIDLSQGAWGGRSLAMIGKWLGIVVSTALVFVVLAGLGIAVWAVLKLYFAFA